MTECTRVRERIAMWLSDEIDPETRRDLEKHLSACAVCAADAGHLRRALDVVAGDVPDPGPAYWSDFGRRLRARIDDSRSRARRMRWTAAMAASVVLVAGLALLPARHATSPERRTPTIEEAEGRLRDALRRAAADGGDPIPIETLLDDIAPGDALEGIGLAGSPTPEDERRLSDDLLDPTHS